MTSTAITIHPDWINYPIVALASRRSGGNPLGMLEELAGLLADVEDRVPTIDYRTLFETRHLDGCEAATVASNLNALCGLDTDSDLREALFEIPVGAQQRNDIRRIVVHDLRAQGWSNNDVAKLVGVSAPEASVLYHHIPVQRARRTGPALWRQDAARLAGEVGQAAAAVELGVTKSTIQNCVRDFRVYVDEACAGGLT